MPNEIAPDVRPTTGNEPPTRLSDLELEHLVVLLRLHLYNHGQPCGADALRRALADEHAVHLLPSRRRIGRILVLYGLTHRRTGWYDGDEPDWLPQASRLPPEERRSI
jgi:hypothetical protein